MTLTRTHAASGTYTAAELQSFMADCKTWRGV